MHADRDLRVLTFDAPTGFVFLTDYSDWQYYFLDAGDGEDTYLHRWKDGHKPTTASDPNHPAQATLPFILPEWILEDHPLPECAHPQHDTGQHSRVLQSPIRPNSAQSLE